MKTFYDEIEERKEVCKTIEDWKAFSEWLIDKLYEKNASALYMQEAILNKYGEKGLDELIDAAFNLEGKYTPAESNMHAFGYKKEGMKPISAEMALKFYEDGREIFLLNSDNTEIPVATPVQIYNHAGLLGITVEELGRITKDLEQEGEK